MLALTALLRSRDMGRWLAAYLLQSRRQRLPSPAQDDDVHLLLCIADHFEPHHGGASDEQAMERVARWLENYPRLCEMEILAQFCRQGFGEVEMHFPKSHNREIDVGGGPVPANALML